MTMTDSCYCIWNNQPVDTTKPLACKGAEAAAVIGWGGVQLRDENVDLVDLCCEYAKAVQQHSCGLCVPCRTGTRVILDLFEKMRAGNGSEADIDQIRSLSEMISAGSQCEVGRSSPLAFLHIIENVRDRLVTSMTDRAKAGAGYAYDSVMTAPCKQACPIHLDIPKYVEDIKLGRFEDSLDTIKERLPMPGIVGRVCVRPCESNCRRALIDEPVQIKHLKRFVADYALEHGRTSPVAVAPKKGVKVAVIGAGPAGITCAKELAVRGYDVTVYEALPEPGGMSAVGIPDYRLPRTIIGGEVDEVARLGVTFLYNKNFGTEFSIEDLEKEGFKAIFVGLGCHCFKSMGAEGESIDLKGYMPGVWFLKAVALGQPVPKGKKAVIVGGGNVAIDCVRTAFRVGYDESNLVYRRTKKEMPADDVEIRDAEAEDVKFHYLTAPKRLVSENGVVKGLECLRMELGEPDASGRRAPVVVPGSEFIIEADLVIPAIGQESDTACCANLAGAELTKWGTIVVSEHLMTSRKGVFAGGDAVTSPDSLIRACSQGRLAAIKMDQFLTGTPFTLLDEEYDERLLKELKPFDAKEKMQIPGGVPRLPIKHEPAAERKKDFREVDKGYTYEEAITEASRCLRCYRVVTTATKKGA